MLAEGKLRSAFAAFDAPPLGPLLRNITATGGWAFRFSHLLRCAAFLVVAYCLILPQRLQNSGTLEDLKSR